MITIYAILCPDTDSVKYVGQTMDFEMRKVAHICSKTNTNISEWIQLIKSQGKLPVFKVLENCDKSVGLVQERYW